MGYTTKPLADGQLPSTKGTLYTVPAGAAAANVRQIHVHNTNAAQQTVIVYLNVSGTSRIIARATLEQNWTMKVLDEPLQLETGDYIEAVTTTATAVDYVITGVEEGI